MGVRASKLQEKRDEQKDKKLIRKISEKTAFTRDEINKWHLGFKVCLSSKLNSFHTSVSGFEPLEIKHMSFSCEKDNWSTKLMCIHFPTNLFSNFSATVQRVICNVPSLC